MWLIIQYLAAVLSRHMDTHSRTLLVTVYSKAQGADSLFIVPECCLAATSGHKKKLFTHEGTYLSITLMLETCSSMV